MKLINASVTNFRSFYFLEHPNADLSYKFSAFNQLLTYWFLNELTKFWSMDVNENIIMHEIWLDIRTLHPRPNWVPSILESS